MFWVIIAVIIAADQYTKYLAIKKLSQIDTYPLIKGVFHLTYVENRGAAFGMLQNKQWFFIIVTIIVFIGVLLYMHKNKEQMNIFLVVVLAMILGGAVGNLIDRIRLGYVVDFLDFTLINYPVFNFADCCVVVGTILLAGYLIFFDKLKGM